LDQAEFLSFLAAALNRRRIPYAVTGSHASTAYGESRFTNDIDVVVDLRPLRLAGLLSEFPPDAFYVSQDGARHAAAHGGQFNVIHQDSALKADLIVPRDPGWPDVLSRRQRLPVAGGGHVWFVAPEHLILKKLDFYREGGSDKHLRDVAGLLRISGDRVDVAYVEDWAARLGLLDLWHRVRDRLRQP